MTTNGVIEAERETYHDLVGKSGWILADFWGPRCEPCVRLSPYVKSLPEQIPNLHVVTVEAPRNRRLCIDLKVMGLPTFILYRDGEEMSRLSESQLTKSQLDRWLAEFVEPGDSATAPGEETA